MSRIFFTWDAPYDGGSPLTSYTILILESDGVTYTEELTECDGTDATILADNTCSVLISTLRDAPYNLPWGGSIWIKVKATNIVGTSEFVFGNGAILVTIPDAPINLADLTQVTSNTQIGLSWEDGASNGGSEILDYRLFSSVDDVNYGVVSFGITE